MTGLCRFTDVMTNRPVFVNRSQVRAVKVSVNGANTEIRFDKDNSVLVVENIEVVAKTLDQRIDTARVCS